MASQVSRRSALRLLGGLGAAGLLSSASCTFTKGTPPISNVGLDKKPAPGRKVNIELYQVWGGPIGEAWVELAGAFEAAQEEIGVRVVYAPGGGGVQQKLLTAIAGGNPPDVAMIVPSQTPQWAELGIMRDLTADFRAAGLKESDFFAPAWESMYHDGKVWQLQWAADPNFPFFWNKNLFEESGLDPDRPPATLEELDEYSRKILRKDGQTVAKIGAVPWDVYGKANSIFTWGWAFGGEFYDNEREAVTPDHDLVVDALQWIVDYAKVVGGTELVTISPPDLQLHWFSTGNVGMAPLVAPNFRDIHTTVKDLRIGAGLLPCQPPGATAPGAGAWFGGWCAFVPTGARQPDAAFEFIRWISATPEGTKAQWETVGVPPGWAKAPVLDEIKHDPVMAPFYDVLVTAKHARPPMEVSDFYFQKLDEQVDKAVYGQVTPIQALRKVKEDTMGELERFRREIVQS